ncbi:hypothetical protein PG995_007498 [Apiospora arundinis]
MESTNLPSATGDEAAPSPALEDDSASNPIIARWASDIRALPDEHRERFLKEMPEGDLYKFANAIEEVITQRIKSSRTLQAGQWIAPLGQLVEMAKPFAGTIESAFPPAGLILGGISVFFTVTKSFVDYQESMIRLLQKVLVNLNVLEKFKSTIPKTQEIQLVLVKIYGDLVKFLAKAVRPFLDKKGRNRASLVSMAKSMWKPFNAEFDVLEKHLDDHLAAFHLALSLHSQKEQYKGSKLQQRTIGMLKTTEQRRTLLEKESGVKETAKEREELRREILDWIPHSSFDHIQDDKHSNSLPTTGGWLFDHDAFRSWKVGGPFDLLWITGKAGSGKSHLAAHTIHNIRESCRGHGSTITDGQDGKGYALAFVYCNSKANANKTSGDVPAISTILGSILRQLYAQLPNDKNVENIRKRYKESRFDDLRRAEIKDSIRNIFRHFTRAYIVVDGLDECSGLPGDDFKDLCQFFGSLATNESAGSSRVVIFSRPGYPTISSALSTAFEIRVDDGSNINDIKKFVEERTVDLAKNPSVLQRIQKSLLDGADGVFLWVSLSIKIIEIETSDKAKMTAAKNTWRGLAELYSEMLQRILAQSGSRRDLALKALLWVANSQEPLTKKELVHALSFEPGMESLDSDDMIDESIIIASCSDLLIEKHDQYELVHFSLAEFLRSDLALGLVHSKYPGGSEDEADSLLATMCMGYLLLDEFREGPCDTREGFEDLMERYPLLRHAASHWGTYLRHSMTQKNISLACDILQNAKICNLAMQAMDLYSKRGHSMFPWPGSVQMLHVIAIFGLEDILVHLPEAISQVDIPDGFSRYPIDYAVIKGHETISKLLISKWLTSNQRALGPEQSALNNVNDQEGTIQSMSHDFAIVAEAAANGWAEVVSDLIAAGADKNQGDEHSATAWYQAAYFGYLDVAEVLVRSGADPNLPDKDGRTPLMTSLANFSDTKMSKRLLECGADVNLQTENGSTALHFLAYWNKDDTATEFIDLLCDHGACTELRNHGGITPLLLAAETDNTTVLKHLLLKGADLTASVDGRTVLHVASYSNSARVLKLLLSKALPNDILSSSSAHGADEARTSSTYPTAASEAFRHLVDISSLNANDDIGEWPIHDAARNGHLECITYLCTYDPTTINKKSNMDMTPLDWAIDRGHTAIVNFLLDQGADIHALSSKMEETPLHQALRKSRNEIVTTLLNKGADPSLKTKIGDTAWDYASIFGGQEINRCVLDHDPKLQHDAGRVLQAMRSAILHQNIYVVTVLLSVYANPNILSRIENSELDLFAIETGSFEIWKILNSCNNSLAHGVDRNGSNALHYAVTYGRTNFLDHLCQQGLDINQLNNHGCSPLILAARYGMTGCVKILCDKGANVNQMDPYGRTSLYYPVRSGCRGSLELLLHAGSDVHTRDIAGLCAADYANSDMLSLLSSWGVSQFLSSTEKLTGAIVAIIQRLQNTKFLGQSPVERRLYKEVLGDLLWKTGAFREASLIFKSEARITDITECLDVDLCSSCHQTYIREEQGGLPQLESLELVLQPVRCALLHAIQFGSAILLRILSSVKGIWGYFQEILERYLRWERHYNQNEHFRAMAFPGWLLVLIIQKLKGSQTVAMNTEGTGDVGMMNTGSYILGDNDAAFHLRYLFGNHSPAEEIRVFRCYSHTFHEVPHNTGLTDEERAYFNGSGDISECFFKKLKNGVINLNACPGLPVPANSTDEIAISDLRSSDNVELKPSNTFNTEDSVAPPNSQCQNDHHEENTDKFLEPAGDAGNPGAYIDIDEARKTLLQKIHTLQPDEDSLARGDGMVLETAWSLVQAIVYGDEARFPRLVELMSESGE